MALNNNCLFNAAYNGFIQGALSGRSVSGGSGAFTQLLAAALAFATEVDSKIAFDAAITTGASNTILAITTNAIAGAEFGKIELLKSVCAGAMTGRWSADATAADYMTLAATCSAIYSDATANLVAP